MDVVADGLTVAFRDRGIRALDGVTLRLAAGEQVALLGPSGAGKTTLLRALLGAVPAGGGAVRVGGLDPWGPQGEVLRLRRACGVVRQGSDLILSLSARTNAVMGTAWTWRPGDWLAVARGHPPARWAGRLRELAARHGVDDCLAAPAWQLSGGQRQRVALLRALLPDPRLLLADEPTAGLDVATGAAAVDALMGCDDATLVVSTHDLDVARRFPRIIALREGRLVHNGADLGPEAAAALYGTAV
ncbi:MAG: ATP-binding cassette domain-containing protein [Nitriliruptorales bacterium]|nr:ATP-binding cassette domain-containing protein [Nitriliruptorales bacterium]